MKRTLILVCAILLVLAGASLTGCGKRPAQSKPSADSTSTLTPDKAIKAMQDFAAAQGVSDPERQIDADVKANDGLVAAGSYSNRIASYNLKYTASNNHVSGLLLDGQFQIKSDIQDLNTSFDFTEYRNEAKQTYDTYVNGKAAQAPDPANDVGRLVANAYLSSKVALIDSQYIKSATQKVTGAGSLTEYTVTFDGQGFIANKDLFETVIKQEIRDEAVKYNTKEVTYTFTVDKEGLPQSNDFHVVIDAIDKTNDTATVDTEVSVTFNSFKDVSITAPAGSSDSTAGGSSSSSSDSSTSGSTSSSGGALDGIAQIIQGSLQAGIQDGDAAGDCSRVVVKAEDTHTLVCTYTLKPGAKAPAQEAANNEAQWYVFSAFGSLVKNPVVKYVYLNSDGSKAAEYTFTPAK
ncbi:MAG: hypothetical protein FWF45_01370 [Coriobacteriia bacterium]|nr:hypothetical protein [Coriobacteriia bacterium]